MLNFTRNYTFVFFIISVFLLTGVYESVNCGYSRLKVPALLAEFGSEVRHLQTIHFLTANYGAHARTLSKFWKKAFKLHSRAPYGFDHLI